MEIELMMRKAYRFLKTGSPQVEDYSKYLKFLTESQFEYKKSFFNLTIDFELAWSRARRGDGVMDKKESLERSRRTRLLLPTLLSLSEKYKIPITFATVAHLALRDCSGHKVPPDFHPRWINDDWYAIDPHSRLALDKDYYGMDLLEEILRSSVGHEIASHSFSHVDIADSETTREVAVFEVKESFDLLKKINTNLTTFVFPNNKVAYTELLKEVGFTIYRSNSNDKIRRDNLGLFQFPLGLWLSPKAFYPKDLIKLIDISAKRKQLINFWCHLFEFDSGKQFIDFFEPIFAYIELSRKNGIIEALTMRDIVKTLNE